MHGIAHITGGGFIENIPRILPGGLAARIERGAWPVPPIFGMLQRLGQMEDRQIYNTFNMGVGMVLAVRPEDADTVIARACELGEKAYRIGTVEAQAEGGERLVLA